MNHEDLKRGRWHGGQLLAFSAIDGPTDYENALVGRTSFARPGIEMKLPVSCTVRFPLSSGDIGDITVAGDFFSIETRGGRVRGVFLDTYHLLLEGPCEIASKSDGISIHTKGERTLIASASHAEPKHLHLDAAQLERVFTARSKWLCERSIPANLPPTSRRTLGKALSMMKGQVYSPEGHIRHRWTTPDRWPHRNMWLWDSVFHALGWRHIDPQMARDAIAAVLDTQAPDGFVAHTMTPSSTSEITQPPVLAWGVKIVNEVAPDAAWIEDLYPKLCAYIEWDIAHRDADGSGLLEWMIEGDPLCRSGESGMDNSPRFDTATRMDAVDFNAFLALECEVLAEFAASLGLTADAAKWKARHERICRLIRERLWSSEFDFFVDYDVEKEAQSPVLASSGFLPLICGAASESQAARLAEHLSDPEMFGVALPVPSIAARDREHYSKDMWRGPMWVNLNWLIAAGFERYGREEIATRLRKQTIQEIEDSCEQYGTLFEFYDDRREVPPPQLLRKGTCDPENSPYHQVFHDYGWTASLYVDLMFSAQGHVKLSTMNMQTMSTQK
jgi:putative isomerase